MTDIFTKKKRSEIMSKIRSKNTKPELLLRKSLWSEGIRYRLHSKKLPGKPDMVIPKKRVVVFVDGCFWHKCPRCYKKPASNTEYWTKKIRYNISKDKRINNRLKKTGWKVIRIWEHEIVLNRETYINKILKA